jgi:hypothetical protein
MTRGTPYLSIAVVADSGTITVGKRSYDFSYSLPAAK